MKEDDMRAVGLYASPVHLTRVIDRTSVRNGQRLLLPSGVLVRFISRCGVCCACT